MNTKRSVIIIGVVGLVGLGLVFAKLPHEHAFSPAPPNSMGTLAQGTGIAVGQRAPDGTAEDDLGRKVKISDYTKTGNVLLVFYKGGWCPTCNFQIHDLVANNEEFRKREVLPVAVSVDKPEEGHKTKSEYAVPFPVLSDPELSLHEAYHVVDHVKPVGAVVLRILGVDLAKRSGRDDRATAIPSMFLIDRKGVVLWAHSTRDATVRPKSDQVLAAVDAALARQSAQSAHP